MTLVAGIDSSTQSCKAVILEAGNGAPVREGRAAHPDGTEIHPGHWWRALSAALQDAGGLGDVQALSLAGQQHGMVLLDSQGRVIRDALLWNDTRSAPSAEALTAEVGAEDFSRRTGLVPVASFTVTKVRWVRDHEPENAARVAAVALPHDWLTWRLRGYGPAGESPLGPDLDQLTTDRSDASGTGYWNPATGSYDLDLFKLAFGREAREAGTGTGAGTGAAVILPRVLAPDASPGTLHPGCFQDLHPDPGQGPDLGGGEIILGAGAGDNAAAALGLGAGPGDVIVSVGTSGTVFAVASDLHPDTTGTVAGFADAGGHYLPIAVTLNAARVLGTIAEILAVDFTALADLALEAEPGAGGVVLIPYFAGERTPNLPHAKASLHGLGTGTATRANIARAGIEGMLCGLAGGLDALQGLGYPAARLLLIGGAVQNPAVQHIAAQVFDLPVIIPRPGEYVARGAAAQAAWTLHRTRPTWSTDLTATPAPDYHPHISTNYKKASTHSDPGN